MQRASQRKFHYIYKIIRNDGMYYIGMHSTSNMDDGYFGSGKRIRRSIKKYGLSVHTKEVIEHLPDRKSLALKEAQYVNEICLNDPLCMNISLGGDGSWDHVNVAFSKERRKEISRLGGLKTSKNRKNDPVKDKAHRDKNSVALKKAWKRHDAFKSEKTLAWRKIFTFSGKKHTDETKHQMRESAIGKHEGEKNSQFGTCWIYNIDLQESKKIKKEELSIWIMSGWQEGRKMKFCTPPFLEKNDATEQELF